MKNVLFILDPLPNLDPEWDTSLRLLRELHSRGYRTWISDTQDVWFEKDTILAEATETVPTLQFQYSIASQSRLNLKNLDLVLIRKEPPFDASYLYLTYLLELICDVIPVVNHPRGIRNSNEKLSSLHFSHLCPETIITNSAKRIIELPDIP